MRKLTNILLALFIVIFGAGPVWAGVRIDRPKIRMTIAPGGYESGEIRVENTGDEPVAVRIYLEDWKYNSSDGGKEFQPKGTNPLSCSPWITFYPADIKLAPRAFEMVRFTVAVPKDARGGHYSVMFFETGGGSMDGIDASGNNIAVQVFNRLGALYYIEPAGTIDQKVELKDLAISQNKNDISVAASLVNTGNVDVMAKGVFNVMDAAGNVYARGAFDEVYTLPGDRVPLKGSVANVSLKPGSYDFLITLEFEQGGSFLQEAVFQVAADGSVSGITLK